MKIIIAIEDEVRNESLINYHIIENDKYFIRNYCEIDKEKIIDYMINDRIVIVIYKIIDLDLIIAKSF